MAGPQHRTREHREARASLTKQMQRDGYLDCVEPVCLMESRIIWVGEAWDVAHDPSGTVITGAAHARCNRSEGATRGNKMRHRSKVWAL